MRFGQSPAETMRQRNSCRSFDPGKTDKDALNQLAEYARELTARSASGARFFLTGRAFTEEKAERLGTYGVISGARNFLVGTVDAQTKDEAEFGYLFEHLILAATALGLGTCWLGGTFKRADFAKNVALGDNEVIPIVSPVGNKKKHRTLVDRMMRAGAGSDKRKPRSELFFDMTPATPLEAGFSGAYDNALELVRIGPSASNKQPWRIVRRRDGFAFYLCRTKGYGFTSFDMQKNDVGIAMCHFELAVKECGLAGRWEKTPPEELAEGWEFVAYWQTED